MDNKKIGRFIYELRNEKGLTQDDLATELHIDRTVISRWERGQYAVGTEYLIKLSEYFNVNINEIIYGERYRDENKEEIKNIVVDVIEENKKKLRKRTIIGIVVVFVIMFIGLLYYFFNTYNSINVYKITGSDDHFNITEGLMMYTHESIYIKLGDIECDNDEEVKEFRLYFTREGEEITLYAGSDDNVIYINDFVNDNSIIYDDIKYIKDNLLIEITYDDNETDTFKLDLTKYFSNSYLIFTTQKINLEENEGIEYDIPDYIINNFELDADEEKYQLIEEYDDKTVRQEYFYTSGVYLVTETHENYYEEYHYTVFDDIVEYEKFNGEEDVFSFSCDIDESVDSDCDEEIINYFTMNYLNRVWLSE